MQPNISLEKVLEILNRPFYESIEFWIFLALAIAGLIFSILAFLEARQAKKAAAEAGTTVKIQTVTIELTEIVQRLDRLDENVTFSEARDLLNEISRKLRRLIAPFRQRVDVSESCKQLLDALDAAKQALEAVRPEAGAPLQENAQAVYFAIQGHFANISSSVADIMGLFEKQTMSGSTS